MTELRDRCPNCSCPANLFESKQVEEQPAPVMRQSSIYDVNPAAESILDRVLSINLVLSWLLALTIFIGGLVLGIILLDEGAIEEPFGVLFIAISIIVPPLILLVAYIRWAQGKVQINISRNLFILNDKERKDS